MLFFQKIKYKVSAVVLGVMLCGVTQIAAGTDGQKRGQKEVEEVQRGGSLIRMMIQESALAGSQFHDLSTQWDQIQVGAALNLIREPENPHDPRAIRVEWQGHLLGYVPRKENLQISVAMDAGDTLQAKVVALKTHRNPWLRLRFAVYAVL
jgi:hypothetical protein